MEDECDGKLRNWEMILSKTEPMVRAGPIKRGKSSWMIVCSAQHVD